MPPRGTRGNTSAAVAIPELAKLRNELRALGDKDLTDEFKDVNHRVATLVVDAARIRAQALGRMEAKAAKKLRAIRSGVRAEVNLGGGDPKQWGFVLGAEFGAYRNRLRLRKSTGGRAYIVRKESKRQIRKAIERIEAQSDPRSGARSQVTGRVRGWNQFEPWTGNDRGAGRFLFPAIRANDDEIREQYGEAIDRLAAKAFPERGT